MLAPSDMCSESVLFPDLAVAICILCLLYTTCNAEQRPSPTLTGDCGLNTSLAPQLDERPDGDAVQDALLEITGGRSVPRVFIGGKYFGGGDDTVAALKSGKLAKLIADA